MIFLFHGDDQAASRQQLRTQIEHEVAAGREIHELDGSKILPRDLESTLLAANLFAPNTLVIEGLLSRLRSHDRDRCLELILTYTGPQNLLLWEKKEVTKANLTKLGSKAKISLSKPPALLFNFLECLYPGNYQVAAKILADLRASADEVMIFIMLARQISYLILAQSASNPKFAPWQLTKLRAQAAKWTAPELIRFHDELVRIDYQIKSGTTKLDYASQLDILLVTLIG